MYPIRISITVNPNTYTGLVKAAGMEKCDVKDYIVQVLMSHIEPELDPDPDQDEPVKDKPKTKRAKK